MLWTAGLHIRPTRRFCSDKSTNQNQMHPSAGPAGSQSGTDSQIAGDEELSASQVEASCQATPGAMTRPVHLTNGSSSAQRGVLRWGCESCLHSIARSMTAEASPCCQSMTAVDSSRTWPAAHAAPILMCRSRIPALGRNFQSRACGRVESDWSRCRPCCMEHQKLPRWVISQKSWQTAQNHMQQHMDAREG